MQALNIQIFVDVMALLLGNPPDNAVFAFDDSDFGSENNGTHLLQSAVWPGQLVRWTLTPIDAQTPVWISDISFGNPETAETQLPKQETASPWAQNWEGYVPACGLPLNGSSPYQLTLRFGAITTHRVQMEGLALRLPHQSSLTISPAAIIDCAV